jgi:RNA 2',3'-cyclic 3'-phosphodiesterase
LRLFVALELPVGARRALLAWRSGLVEGRPVLADALRLVPEESLHLTLCFLGEQPLASIEALCGAVDGLSGAGAAALAVGTPWWLPRRRPNVLAAGVDDDDGRLRDAQGLLLAYLQRATGFEPERRMFIPHITVARVRRGARVRPAPLPAPEAVSFSGSRVILFESLVGEGPAVYRALHTVSL